ncbi:MAG: YHYH domain-containing protein [Desulfococcaceae bacterium]
MIRAVALILLVPAVAMAHPGGLDEDGGHRCLTNCERYGLEAGEYHYHRLPEFHPPAGTPKPIPQGLPDPGRSVPPAPPDPDRNLWPGVFYLLGFWIAIRIYQRIDGRPLTVRRFLGKILFR